MDFFNPLSTPKDLMDIYDMLFGGTPESPCSCDS